MRKGDKDPYGKVLTEDTSVPINMAYNVSGGRSGPQHHWMPTVSGSACRGLAAQNTQLLFILLGMCL
jgi:hypothetical protein